MAACNLPNFYRELISQFRKAVLQAARKGSQIAKSTRGIIFLGVPHTGTATAFFGLLVSCMSYWRGSSSSLLEYMAKDGGPRKQLLEDFHKDFASKPLQGYSLPYICDVYEDRPEKKFGIVLGRVRYPPPVLGSNLYGLGGCTSRAWNSRSWG